LSGVQPVGSGAFSAAKQQNVVAVELDVQPQHCSVCGSLKRQIVSHLCSLSASCHWLTHAALLPAVLSSFFAAAAGGDASSLSQENRALRAELQKLRDEKERLSKEVRPLAGLNQTWLVCYPWLLAGLCILCC
jgi:hypothetical protein